jgi:ribosome-associated protein
MRIDATALEWAHRPIATPNHLAVRRQTCPSRLTTASILLHLSRMAPRKPRPPSPKTSRGSTRKPAGTAKKTPGAVRKAATTARKPAPARKPPAKRKAARREAKAPAQKIFDARSRARADAVAQAALSKKAENVMLIDVRGLTSIAEYFVIASGGSGPQLRAIAESIEVELKKQQVAPISVEGRGGGWVLLDYGDVVAHIFEPEMRVFYDLEGLWADAPHERIEG